MQIRPLPLAAGLVLGLAYPVVQARQAPAEVPDAATLPPITVSASPLGLDRLSMAQRAVALDGQALFERRQDTLGDTLDGLPGIHSDTFGGGASRPVIRGQTAPRVKVLSDGSEVMDAS